MHVCIGSLAIAPRSDVITDGGVGCKKRSVVRTNSDCVRGRCGRREKNRGTTQTFTHSFRKTSGYDCVECIRAHQYSYDHKGDGPPATPSHSTPNRHSLYFLRARDLGNLIRGFPSFIFRTPSLHSFRQCLTWKLNGLGLNVTDEDGDWLVQVSAEHVTAGVHARTHRPHPAHSHVWWSVTHSRIDFFFCISTHTFPQA